MTKAKRKRYSGAFEEKWIPKFGVERAADIFGEICTRAELDVHQTKEYVAFQNGK